MADHALLVKEVDRAARTGSVVLFTNNQSEGKVVRKLGKDGEEGDDGWIDHVSLVHLDRLVRGSLYRDRISSR